MKHNDLVVLSSMGYKGRLGYIGHPTVNHADGTSQYRITLKGTHTTLTFREDEFRQATAEETQFVITHPNIRCIE